MNKAQELIKWFDENGNEEMERYDLEGEFEWFSSDGYIPETYDLEDQGRWWVSYSAVWELPDTSYVELTWMEPATEMQEHPPSISIVEVQPYEKTVIRYRGVR